MQSWVGVWQKTLLIPASLSLSLSLPGSFPEVTIHRLVFCSPLWPWPWFTVHSPRFNFPFSLESCVRRLNSAASQQQLFFLFLGLSSSSSSSPSSAWRCLSEVGKVRRKTESVLTPLPPDWMCPQTFRKLKNFCRLPKALWGEDSRLRGTMVWGGLSVSCQLRHQSR